MTSLMKRYSVLIAAAKRANRKKLKPEHPDFVYYEWHHIYPTCLVILDTGDKDAIDNRKSNLVLLTFPEHIKAHILLAGLHPEHFGLQQTPDYMLRLDCQTVAVEVATEARKLSADASRAYQNELASKKAHVWQTDEYSASQAVRMHQLGLLGEHPSQKPNKRLSDSLRMLDLSAVNEHPAQLSVAAGTHHWQTEKHCKAVGDRNKQEVTCTWCDKTGRRCGMWSTHFDNCLQHPSNLGLTRQQIKARRQAL